MKEEFKTYLEAIDISRPIRDKIETIYKFFQKICPDEITDIFVTDYLNKEGMRQYDNLWFFSKGYFMEAKQFLTNDDFDITPAKNILKYLQIVKKDYDFDKATELSRMSLNIRFDAAITGNFKASKKNCDYLKDIILNHIKPNLKQ